MPGCEPSERHCVSSSLAAQDDQTRTAKWALGTHQSFPTQSNSSPFRTSEDRKGRAYECHAMGGHTDKPIQNMMLILSIQLVRELAVHPDSGCCGEEGMVGRPGEWDHGKIDDNDVGFVLTFSHVVSVISFAVFSSSQIDGPEFPMHLYG